MRKSAEGVIDWTDVDIITVPARTHRATVLDRVRELDLGLAAGERAMVRAIPEEHARMDMVQMVQPPPQLKIGR